MVGFLRFLALHRHRCLCENDANGMQRPCKNFGVVLSNCQPYFSSYLIFQNILLVQKLLCQGQGNFSVDFRS